MAEINRSRIAIDDVVEAASAGVFRALEAHSISGKEFAKNNGFYVNFVVTAGGYPGPLLEKLAGGKGPVGAP
jgi:hypothetical protein